MMQIVIKYIKSSKNDTIRLVPAKAGTWSDTDVKNQARAIFNFLFRNVPGAVVDELGRLIDGTKKDEEVR